MKKKTLNLIQRICKQTLTPPIKLTVSQWAEKYRVLDNSSAFPGRWSNSVTPYLVGIMDEFCNPYTRKIIFCKPTQVGGTEALLNIIGYLIMQDQSPTMVVFPTDALAKSASEQRIQMMIDKCPELSAAYNARRSRQLEKRFSGMTLYLNGANSPSKLASKAVKNLFMDESDKFPGATKKEASPYSLAEERTKTFPFNKKIYDNCTPTLQGEHIWQEKENADVERHYKVPCPHCGIFIELEFDRIVWPKKDTGLSHAERAELAMYYCNECGCEINDIQKIEALRRGRWEEASRRIGKYQIPQSVSFWMNTLYSPFVSWSAIAKEWMRSKDDPDMLQNFVNSWLARPWEDTKVTTSAELVMERQTDVPECVVPEWAEILTAGVDVQENCLYWVIRAWGKYLTSQKIAHGQALSLQDVELLMNLEYKKLDGTSHIVSLVAIDSGDQTDEIYDFCLSNSEWAIPVKGASHAMHGYYKISIIDKPHSKANGSKLVLVDGNKYKDLIASRMRKPNGQGSFMMNAGTDEEYARQVTNEHKINVKKNGKTAQVWAPKTSHADNHYLDCEVYCAAAADLMGVRNLHLNVTAEVTKKSAPRDTEDWINGNNWI